MLVHIEQFDPVGKAEALLYVCLHFSQLATIHSQCLDLIVKKTLHFHNMKREELTVRKEALYLSIRKAQHHSMIETKRRQLLSKTSSEPVQLLFKEVQSADNDKKVHLMLALIDTLGETDVFSGKTD